MQQEAIDLLRNQAISPQLNFINGKWVDALDKQVIDVVSPIDGCVITTIARSRESDVDNAVQVAHQTFESGCWRSTSPAHRKQVLLRWADLIEKNAVELAVLGVRDNGTEINMAYKAEPMSAVGTIRYFAEAIDKVYGEIAPTSDSALGLIHREPVGVVGAIVPWNFPLMIGAWKLAPALAAGNSVVLKPSEDASLSLLRIAELAVQAGMPEGVLNVVTGLGHEAGAALALHNVVNVLVFTGSGAVGRRLLEYSAKSNLKRVYLELGGKSPNIVFADAPDLNVAAKTSVMGIFRNAGQVCVAGSRLLVEETIYDEFVDSVCNHTASLKVGDPLDLQTDVGAINSARQLQQCMGFVERATNAGAHCLIGGHVLHETRGGFYMQPTVFDRVSQDMEIVQDEVFGPVLAISRFKDPEQALNMANDSVYGLASAVWTSNLSLAHRMIRGIRSGLVHVNCYGGADITVPLGGVRQSGNGHDKSLHSFDKYSDLKTAWIQLE